MTHHAVLLFVTDPLSHKMEEGVKTKSDLEFRLESFGIDDARRLVTEAHRRPEGEDVTKTLLVATEFITLEAQQALLKVIEEPPASTRFLFVIPTGYKLLNTLLSRFEIVNAPEEELKNEVFVAFKESGYAERMLLIDEAIKKKNHAWQSAIKKGLQQYLGTKAKPTDAAKLTQLEYVARLLLTRGASNKFLLEHLALTL